MVASRLLARCHETFEPEREYRAARLIRLPLAGVMRGEEALSARYLLLCRRLAACGRAPTELTARVSPWLR
jgi:hypothetical protein